MKKTKPCSRKEHNGEVRGSVLRKAYLCILGSSRNQLRDIQPLKLTYVTTFRK